MPGEDAGVGEPKAESTEGKGGEPRSYMHPERELERCVKNVEKLFRWLGGMDEAQEVLRKRLGEFEEGHSIASLGQLREAITLLIERVEKLEQCLEAVATFGATAAVTTVSAQEELERRIEKLEGKRADVATGIVAGLEDCVVTVTPFPTWMDG